jgi:hypothetical protein
MLELLGWLATAVFISSYFFTEQSRLRWAQGMGASLWVVYGLTIGAWPVVTANVLVLMAAMWTTLRRQPIVDERTATK